VCVSVRVSHDNKPLPKIRTLEWRRKGSNSWEFAQNIRGEVYTVCLFACLLSVLFALSAPEPSFLPPPPPPPPLLLCFFCLCPRAQRKTMSVW